MKYRSMVVDDEFIIRRGIIRLLKRFEEIEVVAEAEDGETALEIVNTELLDLLFVDINMPFLNGLEFIHKMKEIQPKVIIVIITGYDDFEYARDAIRLGVFEYVLKPLMEDVFDDVVNRAIEKMGENNDKEKYLEWAKVALKENKANLVSSTLKDWVEEHCNHQELEERLNYLGYQFPKKASIIMIHLDHVENIDVNEEWNEDLLYYAAQNIANEILNDVDKLPTCRNEYGDLIVISSCKDKDVLEQKRIKCKTMIERFLPAKVIIMQKNGDNYEYLLSAYQELQIEMRETSASSSVIKTVQQFIESNYNQEKLSIVDVAEFAHLSPQHLSRIFRKEKGITIIDYLTKVRIKKAIELFHDDSLKMYEIAEKVGYSTQHYFSNVFKKVMGVSPADYRKSISHKKI